MTPLLAIALILAGAVWLFGLQVVINILAVVALAVSVFFALVVIEGGR